VADVAEGTGPSWMPSVSTDRSPSAAARRFIACREKASYDSPGVPVHFAQLVCIPKLCFAFDRIADTKDVYPRSAGGITTAGSSSSRRQGLPNEIDCFDGVIANIALGFPLFSMGGPLLCEGSCARITSKVKISA